MIFMDLFSNSPDLPLIVSIRFLVLAQSSVYFDNTLLFLSAEAKIMYLFPLLSSMYHLLPLSIIN